MVKQPPVAHRRGPQDIILNPPGVVLDQKMETLSAVFELFITPEILDIIMRETNREADRVYAEWNTAHQNNQKQWNHVTVTELKALIELLLIAGVNWAHMEPLKELWSSTSGRPIFCAPMPLNHLKDLLHFLRFDNKATRPERRATDKLAAFQDVWEMFLVSLSRYYIPGQDMTVDEQLVPFRGRCPFRQYIPSKPAKYGIKLWWNCDATTSYPLKGEVFLGRQPGVD